ncbi:hypothetical protein EDC01DRAFT_665665 [Geopyxis carbonaria]|nr:hypothetical protein EDC01DRAFT_665665 [Geopyxis carbonaria]
MPGKKLNVLSLDLCSAESHKTSSPQRAFTKECSASSPLLLAVLSSESDTEAVGNIEPALLHLNSSTIFQLGLTTPATPSFPQELKDNQSNMAQPSSKECTDGLLNDFDNIDFEQFEQRYQPLSHLPTPPLSNSCSISIESFADDPEENLDPEFFAPASYLANMVPRNASREPPLVKYLHGILQRANLRLEVVSLACCVLDCLSGRFVRRWRLECCNCDGYPEQSEVLAVGALSIAMKFLEDSSYPTRLWANNISSKLFSTRSLALTERLILADLNYCVLGISTPELLEENIVEIKRYAAMYANSGIKTPASEVSEDSGYSSEIGLHAKTPFPLSGY